ncbi:hypothetical protein [Sphingobacterium sp.]|uniref:hypothetical protein n=1 Tax=Sphingobacterium sp. TaxID=341027 RepID=UPI0028A661C1|nr:hypothetical protein [Sphingobacterium sp.]
MRQELAEKIELYSKRYGLFMRPEYISFARDTTRLLLRNECLREGNIKVYQDYIASHYPEDLPWEMKQYQEATKALERMSKEMAIAWVSTHQINIFESDIFIDDEDSILRPIQSKDEDMFRYNFNALEELIYNHQRPEELFRRDRDCFWIDTRIEWR